MKPLEVPAAPAPQRKAPARWHLLFTLLLWAPGIAVARERGDGPPKPLSSDGVPPAPDAGGPRIFRATGAALLMETPATTGKVLGTYPPGTSFDNFGCRRVNAQVWCDVQPLGGGPRGYVSAGVLQPAVSPDGSVALGADDSALRAGRGDFDARGSLPCATAIGQPSTSCSFGVARAGGGYATVVVTRPDGRKRAIHFRMGRPTGADSSEADPGVFSVRREGDLNVIRVGSERYEIPDAVVLGG